MFSLGCETGDGDNDGADEDDEREKIPNRAPVGEATQEGDFKDEKINKKQKQNTRNPLTLTNTNRLSYPNMWVGKTNIAEYTLHGMRARASVCVCVVEMTTMVNPAIRGEKSAKEKCKRTFAWTVELFYIRKDKVQPRYDPQCFE